MARSKDLSGSTSAGLLAQLLRPELLEGSLRNTQSCDVSSREQIKALIGSRYTLLPALPQNTNTNQGDRLRLAQEMLVQDFLRQRQELSKLNRARKQQIEAHLQHKTSKLEFKNLAEAVVGSSEHTILLDFALECANFFLAQLLLLRRWADMDLITNDLLLNNSKTVGWKITQVLKSKCPQQMIGRFDWNFIKANIFSWYSPSQDTWEQLRDILLTQKDSLPPPSALLGTITDQDNLRADTLVQLLLQKIGQRKTVHISGPVDFVFLKHLLSAQAFGTVLRVHLDCKNEFEQYLAEILSLWLSAPDIPKFSASLTSANRDLSAWDAHAIFDLADQSDAGLNIAQEQINCIPEGTQLFLVCNNYWATDTSDRSRAFRESILKGMAIDTIVDARQLVNGDFPRSLSFLRRCTSREHRDFSRAHIIRLKGDGASISGLASPMVELMNQSCPAIGEQEVKSTERGLRIESMMAATTQGSLKAAPWTMLTDPDFFAVAANLRQIPTRIFNQGSLVPNQSQIVEAPQRSLHLIEIPGVGIYSSSTLQGVQIPEAARRYLFVVDPGAKESLAFFSAWFNSGAVQFWYQLESDQKPLKPKNLEKLFKYTPLVRLDLSNQQQPDVSNTRNADDSFVQLRAIWNDLAKVPTTWALHNWIINTDQLLNRRLSVLQNIVQHLFPELLVQRWSIPVELPPLKAAHAFRALQHLPQAPITQHPALSIVSSKGSADFRVAAAEVKNLGPVAELVIRGTRDQHTTVTGPSLYIQAIHEVILASIGKHSFETLMSIQLPLDATLVLSQVVEFKKLISNELNDVHKISKLLNLVFCNLLGLECDLNNGKHADLIEQMVLPRINLARLDNNTTTVSSLNTKASRRS